MRGGYHSVICLILISSRSERAKFEEKEVETKRHCNAEYTHIVDNKAVRKKWYSLYKLNFVLQGTRAHMCVYFCVSEKKKVHTELSQWIIYQGEYLIRNYIVGIKASNRFSCCRTWRLIVNYSGLKSILMKGKEKS